MLVTAQPPHYLPGLAYLDQLAKADRFIVLDEAPFEPHSLQHRQRVRLPDGPGWLTVPVQAHGDRICDQRIDNAQPWQLRTWRTLETNYRRARYWTVYADELRDVFTRRWTNLVDLDLHVLGLALRWLAIDTEVVRSSRCAALAPARCDDHFEHPVYAQRYERGFDKDLAFIDLVLNCGPASREIAWPTIRSRAA